MSFHHYNKRLKQNARHLRSDSTEAEIRIWCELLRKKQMLGYSFNRQRPIGNNIVDFFCVRLNLIIEIDGWTHEDEIKMNLDFSRHRHLSDLKYNIIRFTDWEIHNVLDEVRIKIVKKIIEIETKNVV